MKSNNAATIFLLLLLIFASGCSKVAVQKNVQSTNTYNLDKVLIIGLTSNYNSRAMYERELSFRLREMGYHMFSSVNVEPDKKELFTLEEIIALVEEKDIDGIITIRLKDYSTKERYATSDRYISDMNSWHNYFFNYVDTYYNVYSWSYQPEETITVEANLFDAKGRELIFQVDGVIKNAESEEVRAAELTQSFAKAFHSSGFLKKKDE